MKTWLIIFSAFTLPFLMAACGNSKSGTEATYASSPTSTACLYGAAGCDNSAYSQYYGFQPYPGAQTIYTNTTNANRYSVSNNYMYSNGAVTSYCSCPAGTRPVYNGAMGLGCVNTLVINPYINQAYYLGYASSNYQWVNWNQVSNINGNGSADGCYTNLAWSCFVDDQNSCFNGQTCQALNVNSRMGICRN